MQPASGGHARARSFASLDLRNEPVGDGCCRGARRASVAPAGASHRVRQPIPVVSGDGTGTCAGGCGATGSGMSDGCFTPVRAPRQWASAPHAGPAEKQNTLIPTSGGVRRRGSAVALGEGELRAPTWRPGSPTRPHGSYPVQSRAGGHQGQRPQFGGVTAKIVGEPSKPIGFTWPRRPGAARPRRGKVLTKSRRGDPDGIRTHDLHRDRVAC